MAQHPPVSRSLLSIVALRPHSDAPQSVGLLWKSDQVAAETSAWQHTTLTTEKYPCLLRDSNLEPQQASGRRLTPHTAWPLGPALSL